MTIFEKVILILACLTPVLSLLLVLPKFKKKKPKTFETTNYVTIEQEKAKEQPVEEVKTESKPKTQEDSLESYRDYLNQRKENSSRPVRRELPNGYVDNTYDYTPSYQTNRPKKVLDLANLPTDVKTILFLDLLDRKF